ncbi:MAG: HD domain-containing protein [Myxococcota bacterium]
MNARDVRLTSAEDAIALLHGLGADPHLVQHHRLVAEAATALCDGLVASGLDAFDRTEVVVGAGLHDAGKTLHPAEMHGGGSEHERAGHQLLLGHGVPERFARHGWMHAAWEDQQELEPVLVALADKLWKGKRVADLEEHAARLFAAASGRDFWAVWSDVDPVFEHVAASGDDRLARSVDYAR